MFLYALMCLSLLLTAGCGRHETTGSVVGTGSGAIIGTMLGGSKHAGTGAALGALGGYIIGNSIGKSADDDEMAEERERTQRIHMRRQAELQAENEKLRQAARRWCEKCNRESFIKNANSCASCGGKLIFERICNKCSTRFEPASGHKYCPYCPAGTALSAR